ncbi:MAG: HAD family phosphatase [Lentisphaeria bacterium]|nr:HAD family phosphatase [Lentisphaeria bacterium]
MKLDFRYAIFDMDGLMFDTEMLFVGSFEQYVSKQTGMTFRREDLFRFLGKNMQYTEENWSLVFGDKYSCRECYAMSREWEEKWIKKHGLPVKKGLVELLEALKKLGIRMAVASGSDTQKVMENTGMTGVTDYVDAFIGGERVHHPKPDQETFLIAARALGCGNPAEAVVFEDSLNGMLAAHAGGFQSVIVPDLMDPTIGHAGEYTLKVRSLDEVISFLPESRE